MTKLTAFLGTSESMRLAVMLSVRSTILEFGLQSRLTSLRTRSWALARRSALSSILPVLPKCLARSSPSAEYREADGLAGSSRQRSKVMLGFGAGRRDLRQI